MIYTSDDLSDGVYKEYTDVFQAAIGEVMLHDWRGKYMMVWTSLCTCMAAGVLTWRF